MGLYDTEEGVDTYIGIAEGYDGEELIDILHEHVSPGSTVLELGMGPGIDLDILSRDYTATGSDLSQVFLDRYLKQHPDADLLLLDAINPQTDRTFDCIFSNKVLQHLSSAELKRSLVAQTKLLNAGGIAMHSLWWGEGDDEWMDDLLSVYYTEPELTAIVEGTGFEIVTLNRYSEMDTDDSILLILRSSEG